MKKSLVILFAVFVAVTSGARLPEVDSTLSLGKFEPVVQKIIDHLNNVKSEAKSEDVYEKEVMADSVPEVSQPKEVNDSIEEFREKPTNLKALQAKIESLEKVQQSEPEVPDNEDHEDKEVFLSNGLDKPVKVDDVKNDNEKDEDEEETEDNMTPNRFGFVEEAINMAMDDSSDVDVSFGIVSPAIKKDIADEEEDKDDEENESILPIGDVKDEEQSDENDVQVSFGLAEPIKADAVKSDSQDDSDDDDDDDEDDDDKEDQQKRTGLNEKVLSKIIDSVIQKFAKAHGLKV